MLYVERAALTYVQVYCYNVQGGQVRDFHLLGNEEENKLLVSCKELFDDRYKRNNNML